MGENDTRPGAGHGLSDWLLFWASFLTLIAAGIGFSVRGVILKDWGQQFGFTQSELGTITGGGLIGFGLAIIFFSFFADRFGYGKLMLIAFVLHASSAVVTFAATPVYGMYGKDGAYMCLNIGMWLFALGNGTCEAVINPLTATLFPRNKTHWLNILHAGWPGGLILGAIITLAFNQSPTPIRWEIKLGVFLVPVLMYGLMMFNRPFPRSEASTAGVSMSEMMAQVGMLGIAVAVGLFGLLLSNQFVPVVNDWLGSDIPKWAGWVAAGAVWLGYGVVTRFAPGNLIIAFLYLMHALVGYVELGTDSWITNITETVLENQDLALGAFIWTNALMFTLRFFAGPIVHKINPIGLLFVSAVLGTLGLWLLGQPFTNGMWPWLAAVTVYGIGKTFYWPTLLGVISERFPKGGALALGISGGVGMMAAGLLGGPGIGYKQDYFAVQRLQETSPDTYSRYVARNEKGEPATKDFPLVTEILPNEVPPIAGLDNAKLKVFNDYTAYLAKVEQARKDAKPTPEGPATTLESDLQTLQKEEAAGKPVEPKLKENLTELQTWWLTKGKPNYEEDKKYLDPATLHGKKTALLYTAAVPAVLAVGFLLLILYFAASGGYKQVHLTGNGRTDGH
ncbi:MAG TPA: MFS transporter [Fimbriiglobus sp.]|nr:MFS transporter [Fimbriiglobus sp.]